MSWFSKAKTGFRSDVASENPQGPVQEGLSSIQSPSLADVMRYRYHYGTNIGSIFIMERWLTPSMYHESAKGSSELAAVESWVKYEGIEKTRQKFEKHWKEYVSDADLDWLRDAKCTTIRLPIGYFTLGPPYCERTPFKEVSAVYQNAWHAVKKLVKRCCERGIGVLIDVHGLPGGANAQDHSGIDSRSGKAELWTSRSNRDLATRCICFIAKQCSTLDGIAGIQIINEAEWNASGMYNWYEDVLVETSRTDPTMPVYVSDGWNLHRAMIWSQKKNLSRNTNCNPIVVDTHLYWCFTDQDKNKSPQQITHEVQSKLSDGNDGSVVDRGAAQVVVGEYSCVLGEQTRAEKNHSKLSRDQVVRNFGNAESQRFEQIAGGAFFWTYRMDWMPGGEWGFKQMTEQHAVTPPTSLTLTEEDVRRRISTAQAQQADRRKRDAVSAHCHFWNTNEDRRFEQGWSVGFSDAMTFFGIRSQHGFQGGDKIGMLDLWCLKRLRGSGQRDGFAWKFEHGLRQGIRDFYECVGI